MKHDYICGTWYAHIPIKGTSLIMPDGCRDLIFSHTTQQQPKWLVSPLFDQATSVNHPVKTTLHGFRLKPGIRIDQNIFYAVTKNKDLYQLESYLDDFLYVNTEVLESLECLSGSVQTIQQASKRLGVSIRTLQRLLMTETGRSPSYWMLLARSRHAARAIIESIPLHEVAYSNGYFDQSHLCREIRRWFNCRPNELVSMTEIHPQFQDSGYW